jgi:hypothetical protein
MGKMPSDFKDFQISNYVDFLANTGIFHCLFFVLMLFILEKE